VSIHSAPFWHKAFVLMGADSCASNRVCLSAFRWLALPFCFSSALCRYGSAQRIHTKENMNFAEIGLHPAILKALTDSGYSEPTQFSNKPFPPPSPAAT
jgi:hypothetical protein